MQENAKHEAYRTRRAAPCLHVGMCDAVRPTASVWNGDFEIRRRGPNGLIRKRPPLVGHPVSFRIFRVPFRRSENAPGYPREEAFFGSSPCVRKENCSNDFELPSRGRPTCRSCAHSRQGNDEVRLVGCGRLHVSRFPTRVVRLRRPESCVTSA